MSYFTECCIRRLHRLSRFNKKEHKRQDFNEREWMQRKKYNPGVFQNTRKKGMTRAEIVTCKRRP